ncbi:MAG: tRNA epoxyqueuosine(34) reductase QueG [Paludibacter sp.]|nr:tRNA epoxyqueuosine(34) reductase QueG [Paludibacter sp.]
MIKQTALSLGFDACGIARAEALTEDALYLRQWLEEGKHGDMHYLERNFEKRTDPRILVPGCKSVVVVLMNYFPDQKQSPSAPQIAKYAYSATDYHVVLKNKLSELEQAICAAYGPESVNNQVQHSFVDSAPILERRWAERAGLGWIGKHTQLIHPGLGSYTFIGILLLNIETEYDTPTTPHCGTCTQCIDACPTNALLDGSMDARRCISYMTIERKSDIPPEFQPCLSGNALGCDICADVCPWNAKWVIPHTHKELAPTESMLSWDKENWEQLTEKEFNQTFSKSAIKRAGFTKLKYNIQMLDKTQGTS